MLITIEIDRAEDVRRSLIIDEKCIDGKGVMQGLVKLMNDGLIGERDIGMLLDFSKQIHDGRAILIEYQKNDARYPKRW